MEEARKRYLSVRNMSKYQHYKKDKPIWMKLYRSLWSEREFSVLPDATKAHIIGLFSLCSHNNNLLPFNDDFDKNWIKEELRAREEVDFDLILSTGFIVIFYDDKLKNSRTPLEKIDRKKRREEKSRGREDEKKSISEDINDVQKKSKLSELIKKSKETLKCQSPTVSEENV